MSTDRDLWLAARRELELTTDSYPAWVKKGKPATAHWGKAFTIGEQIGQPAGELGADVGAPPPPLTGTVLYPADTRDLLAMIRPETAGKAIDLKGKTFDLAGATINLPDVAARAELRNGRVIRGGGNSNVRATGAGSKWTCRSIASDLAPVDGFKITDDSAGMMLVDCSGADCVGNGVSTSQRARDWTLWNFQSLRNGGTSSEDHGGYIGAAYGDCRMLNYRAHSCAGYGLQIQYANVEKLLNSMPELYGGNTLRGGMVLSSGSQNALTIGAWIHDCATEACHVYGTVAGCTVADSYQARNHGGFVPGSGVTYAGCHDGERGPVSAAYWPKISALDAEYVARPIPPLAGATVRQWIPT